MEKDMPQPTLSKRSLAARRNGRLGGIARAKNNSPEVLEEISRIAGSATRDTYGNSYYSYLAKKRPTRKSQHKNLIKEITKSNITPTTTSELIRQATSTLEV